MTTWRQAVKQAAGDPTAQCYVMAEAYWHLEGRQLGWKPVRGIGFTRTTGKVSHWWLEKDGVILDLSRAQFRGERFPYEVGRGGGFLTSKPSKRARVLMLAAIRIRGSNDLSLLQQAREGITRHTSSGRSHRRTPRDRSRTTQAGAVRV